jgi:hypothetical protein
MKKPERMGPEIASSFRLLWYEVGDHLEAARLAVQREISAYPAPIPACDADFNALLEERARIGDELNAAHAASGALPSTQAGEVLEEFVRSSRCLSDDYKRNVLLQIATIRKAAA